MFRLEFDTGNAAFDDDEGREVARILRKIADDLDAMARIQESETVVGTIADVNGNRIGFWKMKV